MLNLNSVMIGTMEPEAMAAFYAKVFGWKAEVTEMPNGPYTSFWAEGNVAGNAAAGMMGKTEEMQFPNYWGVYFAVDDVESTLGAVKVTDENRPAKADDPSM